MCKRVVSNLTPHLCAAVQDEALFVMDKLLHYIRVDNCKRSSERERIRQETMESDEWMKLVEEMARVPSAAVNDSSSAQLEAKATEAPADNQPTEEVLRETTESGLPKPVREGKRCAKVIDEVKRIKTMYNGGMSMKEIKEAWPNYEVWKTVEGLSKEDREVFERPAQWEAATGYAKLILSKCHGNSPDTITDWVKAYKKHEKSNQQKQ